MKNNKFGTIFISGSKSVGNLPVEATEWLDYFIEESRDFLIGDCPGVDIALQNYLYSREYQKVCIYRCENERRFNIGGWEENTVCTEKNPTDAMVEACSCAFLLWDGKSHGTTNNIKKLKKQGLPIFIYRTDKDAIRVIRKNNFNTKETKTMVNKNNVKIFADYCKATLDLENVVDSAEYNYPCLPYCLLDSVFSISANYSSTRKVVERYATYYDIDSLGHEHTVSEFLENIRACGGAEKFAENVVKNKQRTSTRAGILKAEAVRLVAEVCMARGIETLDDFRSYPGKTALDTDILAVRGQGSGVMLRYLKMLVGDTSEVKPDRMLERYIHSVLPEICNHDDMVSIIREAAKELQNDYPNLTPRRLDGCIWNHERSKRGQGKKNR